MNIRLNPTYIAAFMLFIMIVSIMPLLTLQGVIEPAQAETSSQKTDYDLSKGVSSQGADELKNQVGKIGGGIVNSVRTLFITFFAIAVLFMGVQTAGGGLKDPRKVELIKGGGVTATLSAVLVYKAEAIVAFVLDILNVPIGDFVKGPM